MKFLLHYLRKSERKISDLGTGSTFKAITIKTLKGIKIPLPPLTEQKRIAHLLDQADKLRQLNKQLIAKYDELTQSLFLEMFGDPVTNPKGWEKVKMGEIVNIVRGGSPRPIKKFLGGSVPWIKIGDATKGSDIYINSTKEFIKKEGVSKSRFLSKGSLIFANCGVSLGFARILNIEGCIHDGWLAFSNFEKYFDKIFLLKSLNSITNYFRKTAPDGTQPNLNTKIMSNFEIIIPPINLQTDFANRIALIEQQKANAQQALQKSDDLFNALLQKVFKNQLF